MSDPKDMIFDPITGESVGAEPTAGRESQRAVTMFGIKNCDTVKRARAWLEAAGIPYAFHDYKLRGIDRATLERWSGEVGWERLLNRSGTTFRKLPDEMKEGVDAERAYALMIDQPSMIKRPVVEVDGKLVVGFSPETYAATFA